MFFKKIKSEVMGIKIPTTTDGHDFCPQVF